MHQFKVQTRQGWQHGTDRPACETRFMVRLAQGSQLRQPVNPGAVRLSSRRAACLTAASSDRGATTPKSAMPVLPPRQQRQPSAADKTDKRSRERSTQGPLHRKRSGGSSQQPQFPGGGGPPQEYMQERALAGLLAYTGMMGTIATAISFMAPGLDLFGNFHLDANDVELGLKLMAPVFLVNVVIMLPNYSSWQLPEPSDESKQQMAEALAKFQNIRANRRKLTSSSGLHTPDTDSTSSSSSSSREDGQDSSSTLATSTSASAQRAEVSAAAEVTSHSVDGSSSRPGSLSALWAQQSASTSSSSSSSGSTWFQQQVSNSAALSRAKDALFLAQGHCLSQNPALILPAVLQAAVLLAECLAAELLYRSVTLQLAGGWISDRLYEAGADDFLAAVTADLPVQPTTNMAGQLVALALLSSAWGVAVLQRVFARRRPLVLGVQGKGSKEAAEQLLQELRKRSEQQQQQQPNSRSDAAAADSSKLASSSGSDRPPVEAEGQVAEPGQQESSSSIPGSQPDVQLQQTHFAASEQQPQPQQEQQQVQASAKPHHHQQQQQVFNKQLDLQEQQWTRRTIPATISAMSWSHLICGVRDISQATALGLGFVFTGNLAVPFAAAVVNQLLFTVLQKRAMERARKRSQVIANQLAGLARQLRDIHRKQLAKRQRLEAQQQMQQQQPSSAAITGLPGHASTHVMEGSTPAMEVADTASQQQHVATDVLHGSSDADDAVGGAGSVLGSRMERTISVLDQLLGEQLNGHAAAGPGSSGK